MFEQKDEKKGVSSIGYVIQRIATILAVIAAFFPVFNPSRVCEKISSHISLFTTGVSYASLTSEFARPFRVGWVEEGGFRLVYVAAIIMLLGVIGLAAGGCLSLGNIRMQRTGQFVSIISSVAGLLGLVLNYVGYQNIVDTIKPGKEERIGPALPAGVYIYLVLFLVTLIYTLAVMVIHPKVDKSIKMDMSSSYKLFLMFLPFLAMAFVFCYLPLAGWRFAFFDYTAGEAMSSENFVGMKWWKYLFENSATRKDMIMVMRNTLIMSGLGIGTSWIPMIFAIFLCEMKNMTYRRLVQTFTTIPNFISWVLVYAIALSIFASDGFINTFAKSVGMLDAGAEGKNYLMGDSFTWIKMWAWGTWKGVGWSAIIYIAGISGIDQSLYEAATVDGAGRFQKMWHITLPGLLPTFFVLLLMAIAGCLSNGLDQYLVFSNPQNDAHIRVLDLWVYNLGIGSSNGVSLSTVIGMFKSVVSVVLLFSANAVSKALRGESIV